MVYFEIPCETFQCYTLFNFAPVQTAYFHVLSDGLSNPNKINGRGEKVLLSDRSVYLNSWTTSRLLGFFPVWYSTKVDQFRPGRICIEVKLSRTGFREFMSHTAKIMKVNI